MTELPDTYRQLLAQLERERANMLRCSAAATVDEVRIAQSGIASGLHTAIAWAVQLFEGAAARDAYLKAASDGGTVIHHDGPSIAEAADDDRRWPLEREGE